MASCVTRAHRFQDLQLTVKTATALLRAEFDFDTIQKDEDFGKLISFVSLHYHEPNGLLYCGLTSFTNQILITFDPKTKKFHDLEYQDRDICERYDVKIHRSFEPDGKGNILFAVSGLHAVKTNPDAPGGRIFRLNPDNGDIDVVGRPVPRDYIQTIAYDPVREIVYGNCYPIGNTFYYEVRTGQTTIPSEPISAHKTRCDREGNLWGISQKMTRPIHHVGEVDLAVMEAFFKAPGEVQRLYRFNPDDGYDYLEDGLPLINGGRQSMANGLDIGDGGMYITTSSGGLYRIDKKSGEVEEIAFHLGGRLEGIAYDAERGLLFLGGGTFYLTHVFVVDVEKRKRITPFWPVADETTDDRCIIVHALQVAKQGDSYLVYIGETDNPNRSGYLWESEIRL